MPLPGGPSAKFGDRYEGRWTVFCMIKVISERADAIRLEPPGAEGEGVEFWLRLGNALEYHQVKRQHGKTGRWELNDLGSKKVLGTINAKLAEPEARYIFGICLPCGVL